MNAYVLDIDRATTENKYFRRVIYTSDKMQLTLMTLLPGQDIEKETHESTDQFIRVESGSGKVVTETGETFFHDGSAIIIPAGTEHQIFNTSDKPLQLYSIYTSPLHAPNSVEEMDPLTGNISTVS